MVLARLLTPDTFGVLVTAQMVISFVEIITDAGFQKYIVQHEFVDDSGKYKSTAIAQVQHWTAICQLQKSAFIKRLRKFALASWIRAIAAQVLTVNA